MIQRYNPKMKHCPLTFHCLSQTLPLEDRQSTTTLSLSVASEVHGEGKRPLHFSTDVLFDLSMSMSFKLLFTYTPLHFSNLHILCFADSQVCFKFV